MTPEEEARRLEIQARVDRGVEKLDADLGPVWVNRVDLSNLRMYSSYTCVAAQLFGEYNEAVEALWPDAPRRSGTSYLRPYCCETCHGTEDEFNAAQAIRAAENAVNPGHDDLARSHGFLSDDEAEICYDQLQEVWTSTIERLRQERQEGAA